MLQAMGYADNEVKTAVRLVGSYLPNHSVKYKRATKAGADPAFQK